MPPTAEDFRSQYELRGGQNLGGPAWLACGVSMRTNLDAARATRARYPKAFAASRIATGTLIPAFGKMMATGNGIGFHITVWLRLGVEVHPAFTTDAEGSLSVDTPEQPQAPQSATPGAAVQPPTEDSPAVSTESEESETS